MDTQDISLFLLQGAIPEAKRLPVGMRKSNLLWDAVWRAHRDVLTGMYQLPQYRGFGISPNQPNLVAQFLYERILASNTSEDLSSEELIKSLVGECGGAVEFGAVQKLVNMTLKYLVVLQQFGDVRIGDMTIPTADPMNCDCPFDSIVLEALREDGDLVEIEGSGQIKWTSIDPTQYEKVQAIIAKKMRPRSNLEYDFEKYTRKRMEERFNPTALKEVQE